MYFKKLELYGFKSFAEKTNLHFEPGVTAIVGPNGCGKSNISDSIKWVLGEQSPRVLRGSRMEDVIFNGTDTKEPINFAEVSLTLSNEGKILPVDYDEVTITRRVFRTGESEYLLNKTQVRLKDIQELLMGTGIGTESYSLIEQGKMDLILSSKPEDRRFVFEEASGITKYKAKKREALRKLEQTEANLLRVNDIVAEVKRQINSLERQAQKAARYKEEFEKLKALELKVARYELKNLAKEEDKIKADYNAIKGEEAGLNSEIERLARELDGNKTSLAAVEEEASRKHRARLDIVSAQDTDRAKLDLTLERRLEVKARIDTLKREISATETRLKDKEKEALSGKEKLDAFQRDETEKKRCLDEAERTLEETRRLIEGSEDKTEKIKLRLMEIAASASRLKNGLAKLASDIQNASSRTRRLDVERRASEEEFLTTDAQFKSLAAALSEINSAALKLKEERLLEEERLRNCEGEMQGLSGALEKAKAERAGLSSKLDYLEDLKRRYEGFSQGAKSLLLQIKESHLADINIYGIFAELISVKAGYEECAEAALGEHLQSFVVKTERDAQACIRYLAENKLGKASFIIEERAKGAARNNSQDISSEQGIEGGLSDFIKCDKNIRGILDYIATGIYVVSSVDAALSLANRYNGKMKFVAKSGELASGAALSGGSEKSPETGVITREAKISGLKDELVRLEADILRCEEEKRAKENYTLGIRSHLEGLAAALREKELEASNKQAEQASIEAIRKKLSDERTLVVLELDEINASLEELKKREAEDNEALKKLDEENGTLQQELDATGELIVRKREELEEALIAVAQARAEVQAIFNLKETQERAYSMLDESIRAERETLLNSSREIDELAAKEAELEQDERQLSSRLEDGSRNLPAIESDIGLIDEKKSRLIQEVARLENETAQCRDRLYEAGKRLNSFDARKTELALKRENMQSRFLEVYKLDLQEAEPSAADEEFEIDKLVPELQALKSKLDGVGPVNLIAIEEHEELKERFNFLNKEHDDLASAKDSLHEAILKINKTTKSLFMETFEKIQVEFRGFFKMLFGGGEAELILIDERDVLETGIEIVARPPGKKLQSISLLSGGEKALTAIALLFAIFKVKPSPFCVLDEIDAPLDEANIERFSRTLADFVKTSQFIIITHNKKTINLADVMYGITMEQSGVSKIVSVKFAESKAGAQTESVV